MWRSRMFWRLFITHCTLLVAAIGLLGVILSALVERSYEQQIRDRLLAKATLIRELVRDWPKDRLAELQRRMVLVGRETATHITLLDAQGRSLADSDEDPAGMENHSSRPEIVAAGKDGQPGTAVRFSAAVGKSMMYVAVTVRDPSATVHYVRTALPLNEIEEHLAGLGRIVWSAVALTAAAAMGLALWLAGRITRPLSELTQGAERIAAGDYGRKVYIDGRGEIGGLARSFNNMSDRLAAQFAELEQDRQQLRTILSSMVEGVVALDAEERILFANERAAELLGLQSHAVVGRRIWEMVRQRPLQEVVRRALAGPDPCRGELNVDGSDNRILTMQATRLPGLPTRGAVLVLHDTTDLRRLERLRQEFVANVSHELKTPLSVIKACVETLLDGAIDDPEHRGRFLEQVADQANRLHALILDLLSLARIESGTEVFEFQDVPLEPLVKECLEQHRARAVSKDLTLDAIGPGSAWEIGPVAVAQVAAWADEEAVRQILENLVDNALKYTPAGGHIWVRWRSEDDEVALEVEDTGIGIPEHDLARIFERFYRADKARSREMGGTGLGLSIVKHLVQAMHGSVRATSRLGLGTMFHVRLPRSPSV